MAITTMMTTTIKKPNAFSIDSLKNILYYNSKELNLELEQIR